MVSSIRIRLHTCEKTTSPSSLDTNRQPSLMPSRLRTERHTLVAKEFEDCVVGEPTRRGKRLPAERHETQFGGLWHQRLSHAGPEFGAHLSLSAEHARFKGPANLRMRRVRAGENEDCDLKKKPDRQLTAGPVQSLKYRLDRLSRIARWL